MAQVDNRGPELRAVAVAMGTVAIIATLLRCYVRIAIVNAFGIDDYLMALALVLFVLFCSFVVVGIHYGTGQHLADLASQDIQDALKCWYLGYLSYTSTMIVSKLSIGYFLTRIAIQKLHTRILLAAMTLTVVTGVAFFFVTMLQCHPVSYFWDRTQPGWCIDIEVIIGLTYPHSAISVLCDFTFALLPVALIIQLNMSLKTKVALIPIMLMACVASSAVCVRFAYVNNFRDPDFLYATVDIAIWSTIEQGLAITAGSLATLRPLFRRIVIKFRGLTGHSDTGPSGGTPSNSFGRNRPSGRQKSHGKDILRFTTFNRADDQESTNSEQGNLNLGNGYPGGSESTVTVNRKALWSSKTPKADNESEEGLRIDGVKGGLEAVEIKSFLASEEHM